MRSERASGGCRNSPCTAVSSASTRVTFGAGVVGRCVLRAVHRIPGLIPPAVRRNPQCDNRTRLQYCQMFQGWGGEGAVNPPSQGSPAAVKHLKNLW